MPSPESESLRNHHLTHKGLYWFYKTVYKEKIGRCLCFQTVSNFKGKLSEAEYMKIIKLV